MVLPWHDVICTISIILKGMYLIKGVLFEKASLLLSIARFIMYYNNCSMFHTCIAYIIILCTTCTLCIHNNMHCIMHNVVLFHTCTFWVILLGVSFLKTLSIDLLLFHIMYIMHNNYAQCCCTIAWSYRYTFNDAYRIYIFQTPLPSQNSSVEVFYSTPSQFLDALNAANKTWGWKKDDFFPYADHPYSYMTGSYHAYISTYIV